MPGSPVQSRDQRPLAIHQADNRCSYLGLEYCLKRRTPPSFLEEMGSKNRKQHLSCELIWMTNHTSREWLDFLFREEPWLLEKALFIFLTSYISASPGLFSYR